MINFKSNEEEIILEDDDAEGLSVNWNNLPATMYVMVSIMRKGQTTSDSLLKINGFGGSGAGNLLGRFAYCSKGINDLIEEIVKKKKRYTQTI